MQLSRAADYALRAMRCIAADPSNRALSIGTIAQSKAIPREFLAKVLNRLTRAGLLTAHAGVNGGYRLARAARQISWLEIMEAIDGPLSLNMCSDGRCRCRQIGDTAMHQLWLSQTEKFKRTLAAKPLGRSRQRSPARYSHRRPNSKA